MKIKKIKIKIQIIIELEYYNRIYKIAKEICKEEEKSDPLKLIKN